MTTWYRSTTIGSIAASTTPQAFQASLKTFIDSCAAEGASFRWQVASQQTSSPMYLVLKRKDASAGRVMIFGSSVDTTNDAALLRPAGPASLSTRGWVCYDPTATTDAPPTSYVSGNPWSAANSRGHQLTDHSPTGGLRAHSVRAYCSDDGQLFIVGYVNDVYMVWAIHAGPIMRAATGGTTVYEGLCVARNSIDGSANTYGHSHFLPPNAGTGTEANFWRGSFGNPNLFELGNSADSGGSYSSVRIDGTWYRMNRATGQYYTPSALTDSAGRMHFLPVIWALTPDSGAVLPLVLKSKNIGAGVCRTRDTILIDNASTQRGFYVGYHGTVGADYSGLSLLNDDI